MKYFTFQLSYFLHLQYETIVRTGTTREHCFPFDVWETKPKKYLKIVVYYSITILLVKHVISQLQKDYTHLINIFVHLIVCIGDCWPGDLVCLLEMSK
jgi:hypothetical protein